MLFAERVLALPPIVVTTAFVAPVMAIPYSYANRHLQEFLLLASVLFPLLWQACLLVVANKQAARAMGGAAQPPILYVIAAVYAVLAVLSSYSSALGVNPILKVLSVVGVLSYLRALWSSADALERFERRSTLVPFGESFGTLFVLAYLPFGIWALYPRVKVLLADAAANASLVE